MWVCKTKISCEIAENDLLSFKQPVSRNLFLESLFQQRQIRSFSSEFPATTINAYNVEWLQPDEWYDVRLIIMNWS